MGKRCTTWEIEGIRQRGRPKKTWRDCVKDDMESLGLSRRCRLGLSGEGELRWQLANPGSPGKCLLKLSVCVCRCFNILKFYEVDFVGVIKIIQMLLLEINAKIS